MLPADMNHRCPKPRSSIAQDGIGSRQNADLVYPLPPLILQLQIISAEHSGRVTRASATPGKGHSKDSGSMMSLAAMSGM
jgi:hypothetical protein